MNGPTRCFSTAGSTRRTVKPRSTWRPERTSAIESLMSVDPRIHATRALATLAPPGHPAGVTRPRPLAWPRRSVLVALGATAGLLALPGSARAQPPAPDLLARLATHAQAFEAMRTRASYAVEGRVERL